MKRAIHLIIFIRFYGKKLFFNLGIPLIHIFGLNKIDQKNACVRNKTLRMYGDTDSLWMQMKSSIPTVNFFIFPKYFFLLNNQNLNKK